MRLLVTNDDGIDSVGLHALVAALDGAGHELVVVAPDRDHSGAGASLGGFGRLDIRVVRAVLPGLGHIEAHALAGPPGMCVLAAQLGAFGPRADYVVAGINPGYNLGRAILHSGTVGAVLTAQNFGSGGLAVSTGTPPSGESSEAPGRPAIAHFEAAAALAVEVLPLLFGAPTGSVLNLNVPAAEGRSADGTTIKGVRWAGLGSFGEVQAAASVEHELLQLHLTVPEAAPDPESDQGLVAAGYASLSPLAGVRDTWLVEESEPRLVAVEVQPSPGGAVALAGRGEVEVIDWVAEPT